MSFEEEWGRARTEAAQRQSAHTRLNQLDDGNGGHGVPKKRLHVTSSVLRDKATKVDTVSRDFAKADNNAMKETGDVKDSLKGFDSAAAFDTFQERWRAQMQYVQGLLTDGLAGPLRDAATKFDLKDKHIGDDFGKGHGKDGKNSDGRVFR